MSALEPEAPGKARGDYDARGKPAAEIEQDIESTRAELGALLNALERRLAPRELVDRGVDMLKDHLGGKMGAALREHPAPIALIGAGIGWLLVAETAGAGVKAAGRVAASAARPIGEGMAATESASEPLYPAGEEFGGYAYARTKPGVGGAAASMAQSADQAIARVRAALGRAVADNPIAVGLTGLVAGLTLGLVLPRLDRAARAEEARPVTGMIVAAGTSTIPPGES